MPRYRAAASEVRENAPLAIFVTQSVLSVKELVQVQCSVVGSLRASLPRPLTGRLRRP